MIAWMARLAAGLRSHGVTLVMDLAQLRSDLSQIRGFLVEVEAKLDRAELEAATPKAVAPSIEERIAAAASSTAVFIAMQADPGYALDQRTTRGKVERLIAVHGLQVRYPLGSRDVDLAKYLAERMPDGRFRLQHALEALV
jgi:hypothetical protein